MNREKALSKQRILNEVWKFVEANRIRSITANWANTILSLRVFSLIGLLTGSTEHTSELIELV